MHHSRTTIDNYVLDNGLKIAYTRYPSLDIRGGCNLINVSVSRDFRTKLKRDDMYSFSRTLNSMGNLSLWRVRSWRKFIADLKNMDPKSKKEYDSLPKRLRILMETDVDGKNVSKTLARKLGYKPEDFAVEL